MTAPAPLDCESDSSGNPNDQSTHFLIHLFRPFQRTTISLLILTTLILTCPRASAETYEWQWTVIKGIYDFGYGTIYGDQGVPNEKNHPGARMDSISWSGADGGLYLFGGYQYYTSTDSNYQSDLWVYDSITNQWTWLKGGKIRSKVSIYGNQGIPDANNLPGGRSESLSWTGTSGLLYMFGGFGYGTTFGYLNDVWQYNSQTNQWTWLKGSKSPNQPGVYGITGIADDANTPGGRSRMAGWMGHDGCLYLFGGYNNSQDMWNDLWKYNPSTNQWTWLHGSDAPNQKGVYGVKGMPSDTNSPGARYSTVTWVDGDGMFYLFGGSGYDSIGAKGELNDLWQFNPSLNQWTWLKGSELVDQPGIYGEPGVADSLNAPGSRFSALGWNKNDGALYLFGGKVKDTYTSQEYLNDVWKYDISSSQWTWVKGSKETNHSSIYGSLGVANDSNSPGSRLAAVSWVGLDGLFYMSCGEDFFSVGTILTNNVWRYDPVSNQWTWLNGPNIRHQVGEYGNMGVADSQNNPGSRQSSSTWKDNTGNLFMFGGLGVDSADQSGCLNDLWKFDPETTEWTWMSGSTLINQQPTTCSTYMRGMVDGPGARFGASVWNSASDEIYLFGGVVQDDNITTPFNDFWRYDITLNLWHQIKCNQMGNQVGNYGDLGVSSPNNFPGARAFSYSWVGMDGFYYLFGGWGVDENGSKGVLNDFWKFNPNTGEWIWFNGSKLINQYGLYGSKGVSSAYTYPGGRAGSSTWFDNSGMLYLFGGYGFGAMFDSGYMNDVWKFNPQTNEWTWLNGSDRIYAFPGGPLTVYSSYGARGIPSPSNTPGGRQLCSSWNAADGNFYLFGGFGYDRSIWPTPLQEFWSYNLVTNNWTWIGGSSNSNKISGLCFNPGEINSLNIPGGRHSSASWSGDDDALYLFGGTGRDCGGYRTGLADIWKCVYAPIAHTDVWHMK